MPLTRRVFFLACCGLASPRPVAAAGVHLTGKMTATDQEAQEGYFAVGRDVMITTRPNSPMHGELKKMVGVEVQVSVFTVD